MVKNLLRFICRGCGYLQKEKWDKLEMKVFKCKRYIQFSE